MRILLALLLCGCPRTLTGAKVTVTYEGDLSEIAFDGFDDAGNMIGPTKTMAVSGSPFETTVLLRDSLAGSTVSLRVTAAGASGAAEFVVVKGVLVTVTVALAREMSCEPNCMMQSTTDCGNGDVETGEACDDGNENGGDGCTACVVDPGYDCSSGTCVLPHCGDGMLDVGEACDDMNTMALDGCFGCAVEGTHTCTGAPSDCTLVSCGNNAVDTGEACDDGARVNSDGCDDHCRVESMWSCAGSPSCCKKCGDNIVQCDEACDGTNFGGQSCLAIGQLNGTGSNQLGCASDCNSLDTTGCGAPIDSVVNIRAAIVEATALPGHDLIKIQTGIYAPTSVITIDECGGVCAGAPSGMTLAPAGTGIVSFAGSAVPNFRVSTGNNRFESLAFTNTTLAISFDGTANPEGNNVVTNCDFERTGTTTNQKFIDISSSGCSVLNSRFSNTIQTSNMVYAITASATPTVIEGNYFHGRFDDAVVLQTANASRFVFDHNTLNLLSDGSATNGVNVNSSAKFCARSNNFAGVSAATAWDLQSVTLGSASDCDGISPDANNVQGVTYCVINLACLANCIDGPTTKALCRTNINAQLDADGCLGGTTNALRDAGLDLGYDLVESSPLRWLGTAPDIGGRESGFERLYGNHASLCP